MLFMNKEQVQGASASGIEPKVVTTLNGSFVGFRRDKHGNIGNCMLATLQTIA
jgi:hypothetical protein